MANQAPHQVVVETLTLDIYMAGDITKARQECRRYCDQVGLCVHLVPAEYLFTNGGEAGFKVGLINCPRFPTELAALWGHAEALAVILREALGQDSLTIVGPDRTMWKSWRPQQAGEVSNAIKALTDLACLTLFFAGTLGPVYLASMGVPV